MYNRRADNNIQYVRELDKKSSLHNINTGKTSGAFTVTKQMKNETTLGNEFVLCSPSNILASSYTLLNVAEPLVIVSTSTDDTLLGSNARTIQINIVDENFKFSNLIVEMNGTTPVVTTVNVLRVNNAFIVSSGGYGNTVASSNMGRITIDGDTTGQYFSEILPMDGASWEPFVTAPENFHVYVTGLDVHVDPDQQARFQLVLSTMENKTTTTSVIVWDSFIVSGTEIFKFPTWISVPPFSTIMMQVQNQGNPVLDTTFEWDDTTAGANMVISNLDLTATRNAATARSGVKANPSFTNSVDVKCNCTLDAFVGNDWHFGIIVASYDTTINQNFYNNADFYHCVRRNGSIESSVGDQNGLNTLNAGDIVSFELIDGVIEFFVDTGMGFGAYGTAIQIEPSAYQIFCFDNITTNSSFECTLETPRQPGSIVLGASVNLTIEAL